MKHVLLILIASFNFCFSTCYCQITSYTFTAFSGTYTDLIGATVAPLTQDFTSTYPGDDGYSNGLPIGFSFVYNGISYSTFSLSTNGWLCFGQSISSSASSNNLSTGGTRPLEAPLWDDIGIASVNDITYQVSGVAPDRVINIQWNNVKWAFTTTNVPSIAFQVKLYETINRIEFIYKQITGTVVSPSASIGISGVAAGNRTGLSIQSAVKLPR